MRLRATISIDLDASDFVDAADHQRRLQELFDVVRAAYPSAEFQFRERRARPARRVETPPSADVTELKHYTGKLSRYA